MVRDQVSRCLLFSALRIFALFSFVTGQSSFAEAEPTERLDQLISAVPEIEWPLCDPDFLVRGSDVHFMSDDLSDLEDDPNEVPVDLTPDQIETSALYQFAVAIAFLWNISDEEVARSARADELTDVLQEAAVHFARSSIRAYEQGEVESLAEIEDGARTVINEIDQIFAPTTEWDSLLGGCMPADIVEITLRILPPDARVWLVTEFDYKLCLMDGGDPSFPQSCPWFEVTGRSFWQQPGHYRYMAVWSDGYAQVDLTRNLGISYDDEDKELTIQRLQ